MIIKNEYKKSDRLGTDNYNIETVKLAKELAKFTNKDIARIRVSIK